MRARRLDRGWNLGHDRGVVRIVVRVAWFMRDANATADRSDKAGAGTREDGLRESLGLCRRLRDLQGINTC